MRNDGLMQAIDAAGGVGELARKIGISQPSVSNWSRVPAERLVAVEAASGVDRRVLRPDLFDAPAPGRELDDVDAARMKTYALLAALLARAPGAPLLRQVAALTGDASPLGMAVIGLAEAAGRTTAERVSREYFDLFVGLGRGELLPYGSYYLTGFLHERPLARLRADLAQLGIERADSNPEPEDHAATLCEVMAGLIAGTFAADADAERQFFGKHIEPWLERMFEDLVRAEHADFYRPVGVLGRVFMAIERDAFALPA